ncbi:MAG: phosphate acyltransferase PlsX [Candidatus Pelethousia sp.]|nr:phosphate acyltransferase PlsX [Candidatus Pelethousia sp.]
MIKIAIDVFGGDNAPQSTIEGSVQALRNFPDIELLLFGDEARMEETLKAYPQADRNRMALCHAPEVISCEEAPTAAIRTKKESSMVRAMHAVRDGEAACLVSAGSTGALLAGATLIVRRIKGVKRPALGTVIPNKAGGATLLMDCGANTDCKPSYLQQFAIMANAYLAGVMGMQEPRIGLLNNGAEAEKGNALTKAAYPLLAAAPIRFMGNCEGRDILSGDFDAVICDGFDGNIVLKYTEGLADALLSMLKKELMADKRSRVGAALSKPAYRRFKKLMDYTEYGGAPLLGVDGGMIKAHGSSNAKAFCAAIGQARRLAGADVQGAISSALANLPEIED